MCFLSFEPSRFLVWNEPSSLYTPARVPPQSPRFCIAFSKSGYVSCPLKQVWRHTTYMCSSFIVNLSSSILYQIETSQKKNTSLEATLSSRLKAAVASATQSITKTIAVGKLNTGAHSRSSGWAQVYVRIFCEVASSEVERIPTTGFFVAVQNLFCSLTLLDQ